MKTVHHKTCVYSIGYHIVFCTKYRRKVLTPQIDGRLKAIIAEMANAKGFEVANIETDLDHVHLFASAPPHITISDLVKWIKGITARKLLLDPFLKEKMGGHLWNPSYYVGTVGDMNADVIQRYIENQKQKD
jgi:putative transposase